MHELVDYLCKKAVRLCTYGEMLGIIAAAHAHISAGTWENTIHTLCIKEKAKLSTRHIAMADNEAQRLPEVYLTVMQAQDCETLENKTRVSPGLGKGGKRGGGHMHA